MWRLASRCAVGLPGAVQVRVRIRCFQAAATAGGRFRLADAGMVVLQVGPEVPGQLLGEGIQAAVVQGGLPFLQVIDDQVADRAAGELVAVDELGRAALPDREQLGQRFR